MTTSPTDTGKRDEADLDAFETWFASLTRMERDQRFSASYFMREAWNAALRLPTPPSQGKVERARELLAQIFYAFDFTGLGHRIQKDGLTDREKTELQIRGVTQALTESSGQGTDVVTEQVIRQLDRAVAWIDEGKTYEISVLRGLLFHASSVLRRTSGTDGACCERMRDAVIEECAQAAMLNTMGPMGNDCCLETRDNLEQAIVGAIRALKSKQPDTGAGK